MRFRKFSRSILPILLLVSFVGCDGDDEQVGGTSKEEVRPMDSPASPTGQETRVPTPPPAKEGEEARQDSAHLTLTGGQQIDGQYSVSCNLSNEGLEITLDQRGTRAPQVELTIGDYMTQGTYQAAVIVRVHPEQGDPRESTGTARVDIQTQNRTGVQGETELSGSFNGAYTGQAGQGTISGRIDRCLPMELIQ